MANEIVRAFVTQVQAGYRSIEGLMDEKGVYYVGVPQVAESFQIDSNQASRTLKPLLGEGFQFVKLKSPLHPKAVNAIPLKDFERLVRKLDRAGNVAAQDFVDDMVGLSLHQLFSDAFGVKFEREDRQEWLKTRVESKSLFWDMAEQIQAWTKSHKCSQPEWIYYADAFDCINLRLFGKKSKTIKKELGIPKGVLNRDHFGRTALRRLTMIQESVARNMKRNPSLNPCDAINQIIDVLALEVCDYRD